MFQRTYRMALDEVNVKLAQIALDNCEGFPFEDFANDFLAAFEGKDFIPVGGTNDGGADGIREPGLYSVDNSKIFYQISIEENHRSKIKKTIDRLEEFGRAPRRLTYVTSQTIRVFDQEEETLTDKHDVFVRIRDAKWILSHINHSEATKKAYYTHLARFTDFLKDIDNGRSVRKTEHVEHPSVYVFLQQQVENREQDKHLTKTVADSLILWALNDTDPDQDLFMTREQIVEFIRTNIPWANNIVGGLLDSRLKELVDKGSVGGKKINLHKEPIQATFGRKKSKKHINKYCLPFETRSKIAEEKAVEESLHLDVESEIVAMDLLSDLNPTHRKLVASLAIRVAQLFFEREGLNCSSFLNGSQSEKEFDSLIENSVFDRVKDAIEEANIDHRVKDIIEPLICEVSRKMFYQSTEAQRLLLNKFSRTYILLFTLQAEPRVVDYFQKATANFRLIVGTDLIIRAISERFLSKENQMTRNMFAMAQEAGITLILSESVLNGVIKHFIVTHNEFKNHIQPREAYLPDHLARQSQQILIRTYYHAKSEGYTKSWQQFTSEFVTLNQLHYATGKEELKGYITQQFGMEYISKEELAKGIDPKKISDLAKVILDVKNGHADLAEDVSLTINAVYGQRRLNKEYSTFPEFGYQTWWLTQESRIQRVTSEMVQAEGSKFIMRPEFILNFFSLAPSVAEVRETFKNIFPSVMGIQMGNRLPDKVFHKVLERVDEWKDYDKGRISTKTRLLCDRLKAEHYDEDTHITSIDRVLSSVD